MLYLWVAAGSAIGGVARFWLSLAMIRLTGAQFPWGTILINVIGSFIIGLFATLTAGGRYGAPIEIRTFVMVGICGGFTTFSSFSLQTLDLLRVEPMQAFGNVALSVLCCLAAVAGGSYAGLMFNRPA